MLNPLICVIDDDDIYRFTTSRIIDSTKLAQKVLAFTDGEYAINYFGDNITDMDKIPDIVFLDLTMPVMDGWQFLAEYIKLKPKAGKAITLYIMSSSVDPIDLIRAKKISAVTDYIVKPFTKQTFVGILNSLQVN
jgi:CheY-like chemotaxis protein